MLGKLSLWGYDCRMIVGSTGGSYWNGGIGGGSDDASCVCGVGGDEENES